MKWGNKEFNHLSLDRIVDQSGSESSFLYGNDVVLGDLLSNVRRVDVSGDELTPFETKYIWQEISLSSKPSNVKFF